MLYKILLSIIIDNYYYDANIVKHFLNVLKFVTLRYFHNYLSKMYNLLKTKNVCIFIMYI